MGEETEFKNGWISDFQGLVTLTLDRVILHTVMHHSSTSTYIPNFIELEETFCRRTDVRTFETNFIRSTRRSRPNKVSNRVSSFLLTKKISLASDWRSTLHNWRLCQLQSHVTQKLGRISNIRPRTNLLILCPSLTIHNQLPAVMYNSFNVLNGRGNRC